jgi:hypothetical protein
MMTTHGQYSKNTLAKPYRFDLTQMLSMQYATRLTPTPNHVLFENAIAQSVHKIDQKAANSNQP